MNGIMSWIEDLCDVMDPISAGLYAALLAVVVAAINVLFRRWLSAGQMALLWGLVLLRLLFPVAPASPLSLQNLPFAGGNDPAELREIHTQSAPEYDATANLPNS